MYLNDIKLVIKCGFKYFLFVLFITCINILAPLGVVFLTKKFIEVIELEKTLFHMNQAISLAVIALDICCLHFLSEAFSILMELVSFKTSEKMDDILQEKIIDRLRKIEYSNFDNVDFYNELYKASNYSSEILKNNLMTVMKICTSIISLGFIISILYGYSIVIMLIIIFSSVATTIYNVYWEEIRLHLYNENIILHRKLDYFQGCMRDPVVIREYRVYDAVHLLKHHYVHIWDEYITKMQKNEKRGIIITILNQCNSIAAYCTSYFIIGSMLLSNKILLSDFIYLTAMIQMFTSSLKDILSILPQSKKNGAVLDNYNAIMSKPMKNEISVTSPLIDENNIEIEFRDVSFRYANSDRYVLKNISFVIKANSLVGIVGANGAGKSTLVKLLLGLYEPSEGSIYINGKDMKTIPYRDIIMNCSVIFQDYAKYATTLKEGVYLGNTYQQINNELIQSSAEKAGVTNFIPKLKDGWDQELTKKLIEEGIELSGGQWQRLALAKTYYKNAKLIILDEPTASLDPKIEYDMFSSVDQTDRTRIIISHRLGNMIKADNIILIDNGNICEMGSHQELIELDGKYATMFHMQSKSYN